MSSRDFYLEALRKAPEQKTGAFFAMVLDMLFSGIPRESKIIMRLLNETFLHKKPKKLITYLQALKYFRLANKPLWPFTYEELIDLLENLLNDNIRSQNPIVDEILDLLSLSERPEDILPLLSILTKIDPQNNNIFGLLHCIMTLNLRFLDENIKRSSVKFISETCVRNDFEKFDTKVQEIINNLRKSFALKAVPLDFIDTVDEGQLKRPLKIALCLSGGGFRATLFHAGLLQTLSQLLDENNVAFDLTQIYAVSGGSISASYYCNGGDIFNFGNLFKKERIQFTKQRFLMLLPHKFKNRLKGLSNLIDDVFFTGQKLTYENFSNSPNLNIVTFCIEKGVPLILSKFSLEMYPAFHVSDSVSASCAFPPVFNSLKLNKRKIIKHTASKDNNYKEHLVIDGESVNLVDGGLCDNTGLFPLIPDSHNYDIIVSCDCGAPKYNLDSTNNPLKKYSRFVECSLSNVSLLAKEIFRNKFKEKFIELTPNGDIGNMPTFMIPGDEEIDLLIAKGNELGEELKERLLNYI